MSVAQYIAEFATSQAQAGILDDQVAFVKLDFLRGLPGALSLKVQNIDPDNIQTCTKLYAAAQRLDEAYKALNPFTRRSNSPRQKIAKLTPEERKRLFSEGRCYFCREQGHIATSCPKKTNTRAVTTTPSTTTAIPLPPSTSTAPTTVSTATISEISKESEATILIKQLEAIREKLENLDPALKEQVEEYLSIREKVGFQ